MVRETRHLWVGNLPDNIREDRIREHFKRYGRVQSVKLLPRCGKEEAAEGAMACTVAFMDIKSASKAHNAEHKLDDRTLTTEYYEPAAIPSAASPQNTSSSYSTSPGSTRFPNGHGSTEEHSTFGDRFYERPNNRVNEGEFIRRSSTYHENCTRGRNRDRSYRNGPYNAIMDRSHRTSSSLNNSWSASSTYDSTTSTRYNNSGGSGASQQNTETGYTSAPSDTNERRSSDQSSSTKKKAKSRSGSRSVSPSGSTSSRSPSRSHSRSSSSSSSSSTSRDTRSSSSDRRPLAICVKNLPLRSSDTSLKDGLFHEYKKHGKVTWVKVVGQSAERYAIVCFKKPEDVEKALEVSYDKQFFGCKIEVEPYQGCDVDDNDLRPYEAEIDEFHPKATRTLFIGNLEKDVTASDLRKHFDQFGEIIEIDIKKQGAVGSYAFCQYSDIVSVVKAIRTMDGEHLGNNRIKLGFGKSMPTNCVWVDGVADNVNDKYLRLQFEQSGAVAKVHINREKSQALVFYEQVVGAQLAVNKMRGFSIKGSKIQVDFASRECQESFFEHLEKLQGSAILDRGGAIFDDRRETRDTVRSFETATTRFSTRYETPTRPRTSSYSSRSSAAASQVASAMPSPGTPGSVTPRGSSRSRLARFADYYDPSSADYVVSADSVVRHFRSYDEYSQGSAASHDDLLYDHEYAAVVGAGAVAGGSIAVAAGGGASATTTTTVTIYNSHDSPSSAHHVVDVVMDHHASARALPVVVGLPAAAVMDHHVLPAVAAGGGLPFAQPDIRNLQKERVHLLEQLEECPSSGDEHMGPKKRLKLELPDGTIASDVIIEANRDHSRKVMEVRRLSDPSVKHHSSRRPSIDSTKHCGRESGATSRGGGDVSSSYLPHSVCKRRKTAGSDGGSRSAHHSSSGGGGGGNYDHSGSESVGGSRPGTPLVDERPEHFPSEPRRVPREREGPLTLPLPRFAAQVMNHRGSVSIAGIKGQKDNVLASPPPAVTSPRISNHPKPPSPPVVHVPPPASPPPRPPSLSSNSSDSDATPPSPSLDERIRSLDEKYEKWSGSRALSAAGGEALAKLDATREKFRLRHNLLDLDLKEVQPSDIVKSVLAKRSVFDEDLKRLEGVSEKYEPKDFGVFPRTPTTPGAVAASAPVISAVAANAMVTTQGTAAPPPPPPPLTAPLSTTVPPQTVLAKLPTTGAAQQQLPKTPTILSPRSAGSNVIPAKGLQYPFPSHPPVQLTPPQVVPQPAVVVVVQPQPQQQQPPPIAVAPSAATPPPPSPVQPPPPPLTTPTALSTMTVRSSGNSASAAASGDHARLKPGAAPSDNSNSNNVNSGGNSNSNSGRTACGANAGVVISSSTSSGKVTGGGNGGSAAVGRGGGGGGDSSRAAASSSSSGGIPGDVVLNVPTSRVIPNRRDSTGSSPRGGDLRGRRNSDAISDTSSNHSGDGGDKKLERLERERLEKLERERVEREKQEKERVEKEKAERERLQRESELEKERLEKLERERIEREKLERERLERERLERERLERERLERERLERERLERERIERERLERERQERERLERERLEKERLERERLERERQERERLEREKQRREAKEREERERREKDERDRKDREDKEQQRRHEEERQRAEEAASAAATLKHQQSGPELKHRHRENHDGSLSTPNTKHNHVHDTAKKEGSHESSRTVHDKSRHSERDAERRKDSIKENRDNNIHEKQQHQRFNVGGGVEKLSMESRHLSIDLEKNKIYDSKHDLSKRKERNNSLPANVGTKRRLSSHDYDSIESEKKPRIEHKKLSERRDSKDSAKSKHKNSGNKYDDKSSSRSSDKHKERDKEKDKERDREREERHKSRQQQPQQKSKGKCREKERESSRESPTATPKSPAKEQPQPAQPPPHQQLSDKDFLARLELRSNDEIEKHRQLQVLLQQQKKESSVVLAASAAGAAVGNPKTGDSEPRKKDKDRHGADKCNKSRQQQEEVPPNTPTKPNFVVGNATVSSSVTKKDQQRCVGGNPAPQQPQQQQQQQQQQQPQPPNTPGRVQHHHHQNHNSSDNNNSDSDEPRKHSIFDIVDDEPAYISMYDKVKARSCKNMQKQEEEKRQEKIKAKFSQLKQSRAKREEKKRSTSWDEDSDSDRGGGGGGDSKSKRNTNKMLIASSDDDEQKRANAVNKKRSDLYSDSDCERLMRIKSETSEDDLQRKLQQRTATPSSAKKKATATKITSDTSDEEKARLLQTKIKTELFSDNEHDQGFADSEEKPPYISVKDEITRIVKKERSNNKMLHVVLPPQSSEFNSSRNNSSGDEKERSGESRKKHKKKQKRSKHSPSCEEGTGGDETSISAKHQHEKKRPHGKKEKKRDKNKDEREKTKKSKKKAELKAELKRDGKIENIFGSLSEESEQSDHKPPPLPPPRDRFVDDGSDSEHNDPQQRMKEEHRKRKEKKRRDKERRLAEEAAAMAASVVETNENSMDYADMAKQLEANIKDDSAEETNTTATTATTNTAGVRNECSRDADDSFDFGHEPVSKKEAKEKKKKRKKSKEEKQKHHHHHHHEKRSERKISDSKPPTLPLPPFEDDAKPIAITPPIVKKEEAEKEAALISNPPPSTPTISKPQQSLPSLLADSPPQNIPADKNNTVVVAASASPTPIKETKEKKRVLPGFGSEIDEKLHESAVKSISAEFEAKPKDPVDPAKPAAGEDVKTEEPPAEKPEEKPRVVISQEETEDAVAALLGESFGSGQFESCYSEELNSSGDQTANLPEEESLVAQDDEEMRQAVQSLGAAVTNDIEAKPDTPQSEHELQIDTDTEEQEEAGLRFDHPPKTPEIPKTPEMPAYIKAAPTSPPSLTPIKSTTTPPQKIATPPTPTPAAGAKIAAAPSPIKVEPPTPKTPEPPKSTLPSLPMLPDQPPLSVISQGWAVTSTTAVTEARVTPPLRTYVGPAVVKIADYPPLTAISKAQDNSNAVVVTQAQQQQHKTLHSLPQITATTTVPLNRLPITPVKISKPLQATTMILPQAKVAHSLEPPVLVPTKSDRIFQQLQIDQQLQIQQQRPRMVFHGQNYHHPTCNSTGNTITTGNSQQPRMILQATVQRPPVLVPRGLPPTTAYGFITAATNHGATQQSQGVVKQAIIVTSSPMPKPAQHQQQQTTPFMAVIKEAPPKLVSLSNATPKAAEQPKTITTAPIIQNPQVIVHNVMPAILAQQQQLQQQQQKTLPVTTPVVLAAPIASVVPAAVVTTAAVALVTTTAVASTSSTVTTCTAAAVTVTSPAAVLPTVVSKEERVIQPQAPIVEVAKPQPALTKTVQVLESPKVATSEAAPVTVQPPPKQLAIERVTDELNLTLKKKIEVTNASTIVAVATAVTSTAATTSATSSSTCTVSTSTTTTTATTTPSVPVTSVTVTAISSVASTVTSTVSTTVPVPVAAVKEEPVEVKREAVKEEVKAKVEEPKEDSLDTKEDSDYWSAKEVNIDSVIKTLCSADELSDDQSVKVEDVKKAKEEEQKKVEEQPPPAEEAGEESCGETEDKASPVVAATAPPTTPTVGNRPGNRRSPRARGGKGAKAARGGAGGVGGGVTSGIQTRRKGKEVAAAAAAIAKPTTPPKRGGRGGKAKNERKSPRSESEPASSGDVYEFRDDSDEHSNPNKERPRLILTIKSPAIGGGSGDAVIVCSTAAASLSTSTSTAAPVVSSGGGNSSSGITTVTVTTTATTTSTSTPTVASKPIEHGSSSSVTTASTTVTTNAIVASSIATDVTTVATATTTSTAPAAIVTTTVNTPIPAAIATPTTPTTTQSNTTKEDFASPASNTRKSRRLQERDIRSTVDDTIEDVVKNAVVTRASAAAAKRSTRATPIKTPAPTALPETPRKSPRGGAAARRKDRRASEASSEESAEDKVGKVVEAEAIGKPADLVAGSLKEVGNSGSSGTTIVGSVATAVVVEAAKTEATVTKGADHIVTTTTTATTTTTTNTTTPSATATTAVTAAPAASVVVVAGKEKPHEGLKAAMLRRVKGEMTQEPMTLIDPVTGLLTPMRECEEGRYIPLPGTAPSQQQQQQMHHQQQLKQIKAGVVEPAQKSVITQPKNKPQSLKAHVLSSQAAIQQLPPQQLPPQQPLKKAILVNQTQAQAAALLQQHLQPLPSQQQQQVSIAKPLNVTVSSPMTYNVAGSQQQHLSPRPNVVQPQPPPVVAAKAVVTVKPTRMSPGMGMTPQQQLQHHHPAKQQHAKGMTGLTPSQPMQVQSHHNAQMMQQQQQQQRIKQSVLAKQQQLLIGSVAANQGLPPIKGMAPNQSNRVHPSSHHPKGVMEPPPKIDVGLSNVILGPRANLSPQSQQPPRHVTQAGLAAYEASMGEAITHFPPGSVPLRPPHDLPPAHYMHHSHIIQQYQFLRQPYHMSRSPMVAGGVEKSGDGQEGEEAPVTSPPLELRRPASANLALSGRTVVVPHSLHSPHDRTADSPQMGQAQVYNMHTAKMQQQQQQQQHYHTGRYYEPPTEPPPAHRPLTSHGSLAALGQMAERSVSHMASLGAPERPLSGHHVQPDRPLSSHSALAAHMGTTPEPRPLSTSHLPSEQQSRSALSSHGLALVGAGLGAAGNLLGAVARHVGVDAPAAQRGVQATTPPHASQVPAQHDSLFILLKQYPCMWQGLLALKNDQAAVQMYFVSGNEQVAKCSLPRNTDGSTPPLRIFQRMRLEPPQVEGVARKMQMENEHCMLLALPCGHNPLDVLKQSTNLTSGFITYLQQKQAAGIVNVAAPGTTQPPAYVVHIFPKCDFVNENLRRIAPSLLERVSDIAHLLIVITTV